MYSKVAVKVLSAHGATPADMSSAKEEINNKAYAAKACSQVVRVFAHCIKDQQGCLAMLPHQDSLAILVRGKLRTRTQLCVSALESEHQALCTFLSLASDD